MLCIEKVIGRELNSLIISCVLEFSIYEYVIFQAFMLHCLFSLKIVGIYTFIGLYFTSFYKSNSIR